MQGRYGKYGGQYIPETLMAAVDELTAAFDTAVKDDGFRHEFEYLSRTFSGRPTPVYRADRLTEHQRVQRGHEQTPKSSDDNPYADRARDWMVQDELLGDRVSS